MSDLFAQLAIFFLGPTAVILANSRWRKWAPIVGLASQPFWFWTTIAHHQYPVLVTCVIYTGAWMFGFYNLWLKKGA
jgi:hypothetical protein